MVQFGGGSKQRRIQAAETDSSSAIAEAIAQDKDLTKKLLHAAGVPVPQGRPVLDANDAWVAAQAIGTPVVVKPRDGNQGKGVTVNISTREDIEAAFHNAAKFRDEVMVERFVPGQELTVGILGDAVLPTIEIQPVKELYDYECKYTPGMAREFVADLDSGVQARLGDQARRAFVALKLGGYARIDFRLDPSGEPWCLEANTLPGMTPTSLIPQAAQAAGVLFPDLCERIVQLALTSHGRSRR
jgi:D-alanine--D-alanine ligase